MFTCTQRIYTVQCTLYNAQCTARAQGTARVQCTARAHICVPDRLYYYSMQHVYMFTCTQRIKWRKQSDVKIKLMSGNVSVIVVS